MTRGLISGRDLAYYTTKGIACQQKSVSSEYFRKKEAPEAGSHKDDENRHIVSI